MSIPNSFEAVLQSARRTATQQEEATARAKATRSQQFEAEMLPVLHQERRRERRRQTLAQEPDAQALRYPRFGL